MSHPKVSIVIPTYNRPKKLIRAVESVIEQTYTDWELIVVDDSSDVDAEETIPDDDRIRYIQHECNKGAPAARNTGIDASNGEFIALLDDDDAWKSEKIERQLKKLQELSKGYGMLYSGRDIIRDGDFVETYIPTESGYVFNNLLERNHIPSETPLIRRGCFSDVGGFDTAFQSFQDLDMWLRIADAYKIGVVSESLAIAYHGHDDQISNDADRKYAGLSRLLNKYGDEFKNHPQILAQRYKTLGVHAARTGRRERAKVSFKRSIRLGQRDPLNIAYTTISHMPAPVMSSFFDIRDKHINQ